MSPTDSRHRLDPDELAALEEQRDFLLASLDDLDREHDVGDIEGDDYRALKDDYTARAAEVLRAIDERREAFAGARRPRRRGRLIATGAAVVLIALGAGLLVAHSSGQRKAGDTITGGITTTPVRPAAASSQAEVMKCTSTFQAGKAVDGLKCLEAILAKNPNDAFALTFRGWLLWQVVEGTDKPDLVAKAKADINRGAQLAPQFPVPHVFLAFIANSEGDRNLAKAELAKFDAMGGSSAGKDAAVQALRDELAAPPTAAAPIPSTPTTAAP